MHLLRGLRHPALPALALALLAASPAAAQPPEAELSDTVRRIEQQLDAKIGLVIRDSGSDWHWHHRAEDRVLLNSTFKVLLCAKVLKDVDDGMMELEDTITVTEQDLLSYAPVTQARVGQEMSLAELCQATLDMSDNTAANLLLDRIGGPAALTRFLRDSGDTVGRLDRREPELNTPAKDGMQDTSTPAAMAATLQALITGDVLSGASQAQLRTWMSEGGVTGALLRSYVPGTWQVADKSGSGDTTRNLIAMVTPAADDPYFIAIYLADARAPFETRNAAMIDLSKAVASLLQSR
ncbi:class A beta-lactamase [Epibacterium sp. MM17-32]|uniref:class A beta-lactamase n=1 Tax=Epibacterium sp. MM17-32 TaxID=2917734 RepID=UPI001EF7216B|nr:class A beta-lactamase [Epibacterium sp. MM17-32]MCG7630029.1 class A beta-lactamase [Epibacterium sp. MM17-32]